MATGTGQRSFLNLDGSSMQSEPAERNRRSTMNDAGGTGLPTSASSADPVATFDALRQFQQTQGDNKAGEGSIPSPIYNHQSLGNQNVYPSTQSRHSSYSAPESYFPPVYSSQSTSNFQLPPTTLNSGQNVQNDDSTNQYAPPSSSSSAGASKWSSVRSDTSPYSPMNFIDALHQYQAAALVQHSQAQVQQQQPDQPTQDIFNWLNSSASKSGTTALQTSKAPLANYSYQALADTMAYTSSPGIADNPVSTASGNDWARYSTEPYLDQSSYRYSPSLLLWDSGYSGTSEQGLPPQINHNEQDQNGQPSSFPLRSVISDQISSSSVPNYGGANNHGANESYHPRRFSDFSDPIPTSSSYHSQPNPNEHMYSFNSYTPDQNMNAQQQWQWQPSNMSALANPNGETSFLDLQRQDYNSEMSDNESIGSESRGKKRERDDHSLGHDSGQDFPSSRSMSGTFVGDGAATASSGKKGSSRYESLSDDSSNRSVPSLSRLQLSGKPYSIDTSVPYPLSAGPRSAASSSSDLSPRHSISDGPSFSPNAANGSSVEVGKKLYDCKICGRKFPRPSALIVHERIHSGDKPFVCEECGRPFTVASNLRRHQKIHVKQVKMAASDRPPTLASSNTSTIKPRLAARPKKDHHTADQDGDGLHKYQNSSEDDHDEDPSGENDDDEGAGTDSKGVTSNSRPNSPFLHRTTSNTGVDSTAGNGKLGSSHSNLEMSSKPTDTAAIAKWSHNVDGYDHGHGQQNPQ